MVDYDSLQLIIAPCIGVPSDTELDRVICFDHKDISKVLQVEACKAVELLLPLNPWLFEEVLASQQAVLWPSH